RKGRGDINRGRVGAGCFLRLAHRLEHRQAEMRASALSRRDTADHFGAVGDGLFGMERALRPGEALADNPRVLVNEDRHDPSTFITIRVMEMPNPISLTLI